MILWGEFNMGGEPSSPQHLFITIPHASSYNASSAAKKTMRLSISARIFGGFLVVMLTFSGVMGYTFHRMQRQRLDLHLINKIYLKLILNLAELSATQGNLPNPVAERMAGRGTDNFLRDQVLRARRYRLRYLESAIKVVDQSEKPEQPQRQFMGGIRNRLLALQQSFRANEADFESLFANLGPVEKEVADTIGEKLLRAERKLLLEIRQLRDDLARQMKAAALQVEEDEDNAAWATVVLALVAILVSFGVTFGAQLTIRPLKKLVAGTKRIASGEYGHRVQIASRDELGLLGQEFNSMAAAIEEREHRLIRSERMAAAGQIASHITHEIRNPLSSISLNTELLEEELGEMAGMDEAKNLCQAMRREVDRLTEITEEYLRFARLPRPRLAPEDVNEILLNLLSFMAGELREKKVEVSYHLQPELPVVSADENQLRQAFLNLIRNACEAMAGIAGTLRVSTDLVDSEVLVSFADTGQGMDEETLAKIFDPFFTTKESGTGLGLALTQQIIAGHGGVISVKSVPRRGTVFSVKLPATHTRVAELREKLEPPADER
jgi:two-component system, NtrC family, sensor kinase